MDNYSSSVFYVEVITPAGGYDIGTAFHLGDGFFATARHVIAGNKITKLGRNDTSQKSHFTESGAQRSTRFPFFETDKIVNTYVHPSEAVDVALIEIDRRDIYPIVQLDPGTDARTEGEYLMQEVVTLGYPPIPFATGAHLVVFRGEVSAVIENRIDKHRHFVISGMARGGFSGGPVLSVDSPNRAIGLVCNSLVDQKNITVRSTPSSTGASDSSVAKAETPREVGVLFEELGFIGAISVGAIFELVDHQGLKIREIESSKAGFVAREAPVPRRGI